MRNQSSIQATLSETTSLGPVRLALLPEASRFSLRTNPKDLGAVSKALGVTLPPAIGERSASGTRSALCLGPDEWEIIADEAERGDIETALAAIYAKAPHSLTDTSDREITVKIEGDKARELLSVACPIDLDRLEVGCGKRTLFDSAQVVLYCDAADSFRMQVWRSFLPHVWELLNIANSEFAAGH
ncbi:MAG: sarcosine oxidase subunit gamma [Hyphomicrobiales bacterium]|nr:sarcosine oxidase subunit gamma [Hyphomicrobiales bacterium]